MQCLTPLPSYLCVCGRESTAILIIISTEDRCFSPLWLLSGFSGFGFLQFGCSIPRFVFLVLYPHLVFSELPRPVGCGHSSTVNSIITNILQQLKVLVAQSLPTLVTLSGL